MALTIVGKLFFCLCFNLDTFIAVFKCIGFFSSAVLIRLVSPARGFFMSDIVFSVLEVRVHNFYSFHSLHVLSEFLGIFIIAV